MIPSVEASSNTEISIFEILLNIFLETFSDVAVLFKLLDVIFFDVFNLLISVSKIEILFLSSCLLLDNC